MNAAFMLVMVGTVLAAVSLFVTDKHLLPIAVVLIGVGVLFEGVSP